MTEPQIAAAEPAAEPADPAAEVPGLAWQIARNGKRFYRIPGVGGYQGIVWQAGTEETVPEALERKRRGGNQRPPKSRRKRIAEDATEAAHATVRDKPSPVSRDETTRKIQSMCEDILCGPSVTCAAFGMEWEADHFTIQGERFAAALARSSERNPWLRKLLERGLEGEQTAVALLTTLTLAGGAAGYVMPPLMKWGVLPSTPGMRRGFNVPDPRPAGAPPPAYHPPPVTDAMANVTALWQAAEQMAATPTPPAGNMPADGDPHPGVPIP